MASAKEAIELLKKAEREGNEELATKLRERLNAAGYDATAVRKLMLSDYSQTGSGLRGLAQGVSFGFSDEIEAAFRSALDSEREYEDVIAQVRQDYDLSQQANPWTYGGAEVAGGFAVPGVGAFKGAAGLARVAPKMSAGSRLAATGAAEGAVAGAGYSEADTAGGVAADAATGAATGAVFAPLAGKATQKAVEYGGRVASRVRDAAVTDPRRAAQARLRQRLEDEGITDPAEIRARLEEMGPEARLADLGPVMQQEATAVSKIPGRGRKTATDFVRNRQETQHARLKQAGREAVDPQWEDYRGMMRTIDQTLENKARDAYGDAYERLIQPTPDLARLAKMPQVRRAMEKAQEALQNDPDLYMDGTGLSVDGKLSTRWLDKTIRVLRDDAKELQRAGRNDEAAQTFKTIDRMKQELYASNPELEKAHGVYRGAQELKEAGEMGREIMAGNKKFDDYLDIVEEGISDSEEEAFRVGLLQGMFDRVRRATSDKDASGRIIPSGEVEDILQSIFKGRGEEEVLEEFLRKVDAEKEFRSLHNRVTGPAGSAEARAGMAGDANVGGMWDMAFRILRKLGAPKDRLDRLTSEEAAELADMLFGDLDKLDLEEVVAPTLGFKVRQMDMGSRPATMVGGSAASVGTGEMTEMME